ncbi:MAG TPA: hypothetical protein VK137_15300, partial [Planctomycetaceae bacterium]|nr:hypothetical protein [Planctomycetaceae bacterium]
PRVEAAIFESHPAETLATGLGCERCDVSVLVGQATDDLLPLIHAVPPEGAAIIPANAAELDRLVSTCRGHVVLYSLEGETPRLREHQARDGRVAFCLRDSLVLGTGPNAFFLSLKGLDAATPAPREHLLPAVAAAWSVGVPVELLRDILGRTGL